MIKQNRRTWYLQKTSRSLAGSTRTTNHSGKESCRHWRTSKQVFHYLSNSCRKYVEIKAINPEINKSLPFLNTRGLPSLQKLGHRGVAYSGIEVPLPPQLQCRPTRQLRYILHQPKPRSDLKPVISHTFTKPCLSSYKQSYTRLKQTHVQIMPTVATKCVFLTFYTGKEKSKNI
jgi:hypothetical protein